MLEIRNICKTYRPKSGPPVQALKSVSVKFADKGLVFILGKSGCGKSTLLNTIGGLDSFDSGEIIIKGKSSKEFTGSDFDSYRNTFIGFIFQEYNILSEFNIEKNIALALELQGKKATPEAVQKILDMVDLGTMGKRKTTELSGGQKQRVAIARALIKEPEIIIADEPTGALDSATGIQVFDTLKKLAQDKLVIVVSHDREFAEIYGDRIIEMKDGVVISDETKRKVSPKSVSDDLTMIGDDLIHIRKGHKFSEDEKETIIKFLESRDTETIISVDPKNNQKFKQVAKIDENNQTEKFTETTDVDRGTKEYNKKDLKLIKSKLKFKDSFKIGASGLKSKPVRLFFTILLSLVAFTLFGFVDSLSAYNKVSATVNSIVDGDIKNLAFRAEEKQTSIYTDWNTGEEEDYVYYNDGLLTGADIAKLNKDLDINLKGVYSTSSGGYGIYSNFKDENNIDFYSSYLRNNVTGFINLTESEISSLGYTLTGRMPEGEDEIVITEYIYKAHTFAGYRYGSTEISKDSINMRNDGNANSIIGKNYYLDGKTYTIVGIMDTKFDYEKYKDLDPTNRSNGNTMSSYMVGQEVDAVVKNGYHAVVVVSQSFLNNLSANKDYAVKRLMMDGNNVMGYDDVWVQNGTNMAKIYTKNQFESVGATYYLFDENASLTTLASNQIIVDIAVLNAVDPGFLEGTGLSSYFDDFYSSGSSIGNVNTYLTSNPDKLALLKSRKGLINTEDLKLSVAVYGESGNSTMPKPYEVVGFCVQNLSDYSARSANMVICSDSTVSELVSNKYTLAIAQMPTDRAQIQKIVEYFYDNYENSTGDKRFVLSNEVSAMILQVNDLLESLSGVLLWVGVAFCVFAALMLMNFISTSISYKKREIGILRAIGARKKDVFSIFYNESLIIAMINFVLSLIATVALVNIVNNALRNEYGLVITIINFGVRQIGILLIVSIVVAVIASLLPVMKISKKQPIDAINNR